MANQAPALPKWIEDRVLPAVGVPVRSVHMLKEGGLRRSALLLTDGTAFVGEKRWLTGVRLYEVELPEDMIFNESHCPHCDKELRRPIRKEATIAGKAKAPSKAPVKTASSVTIPVGDATPIIDVEGIGPTFAKRLEAAGIPTTEELLRASPQRVAEISQAPEATIAKWYAMSELMRVKGIGKQFAELLVRSDIDSIGALKKQTAAKLLKRVEATMASVDVTIQGAPLNTKRVGQWIASAKKTKTKRVAAL
jgi:predicted flap endonuclease-1-like 5' DNA nuclease